MADTTLTTTAPAGRTLYALLRDSATEALAYNTTTHALETFSAGSYSHYVIPLVDASGIGAYSATIPSQLPAGSYIAVAYQQLGGSPAVGDPLINESAPFLWSGTAAGGIDPPVRAAFTPTAWASEAQLTPASPWDAPDLLQIGPDEDDIVVGVDLSGLLGLLTFTPTGVTAAVQGLGGTWTPLTGWATLTTLSTPAAGTVYLALGTGAQAPGSLYRVTLAGTVAGSAVEVWFRVFCPLV